MSDTVCHADHGRSVKPGITQPSPVCLQRPPLPLLLRQFAGVCFLPDYGNATFLLMNHVSHEYFSDGFALFLIGHVHPGSASCSSQTFHFKKQYLLSGWMTGSDTSPPVSGTSIFIQYSCQLLIPVGLCFCLCCSPPSPPSPLGS